MRVESRETLDKCREEACQQVASYNCRILVCSGTGCVATGSEKIYPVSYTHLRAHET